MHAVIRETKQSLAEVEHSVDLLIDDDPIQPLVGELTVTLEISS